MIVVVASRFDDASQKIVERWASNNAAICTCEDLSTQGWRHYLGSTSSLATAVIGGRQVKCDEINGILIRRPCIFEQELLHISALDRPYVAAEMNAFLISWLSSLNCPILNRPTAMSLSGPNWRPEQWVHEAANLGIPVSPIKKCWSLVENKEVNNTICSCEEVKSVTVVGDLYFGDVEKAVGQQATKLAHVAGTELLEVHFSGSKYGSCFLTANTCPNLNNFDKSDAVLHHLINK
ncbi:MAG: hypothetical protein WA395_16485 [Nitrososphaeraceae archaeon]